MSKNKTIDELNKELAQWDKTKSYLNSEISAVENSTKNIVNWMQVNTKEIQHRYFAIEEALWSQNEEDLERVFLEAGTALGFFVKMPTSDEKTILDAAIDLFSKHKNNDMLSKIAAIESDFPEKLFVKAEDLYSEDTTIEEDVHGFKKSWWEPESNVNNKKKKSLIESLELVRNEVIGLQTEKPFYIDSFFEWVEATQTAREDVPGDGEYYDFLCNTYRNPEYLLTQVYSDSNETIQAVYEDIYKNTVAYNAIKAGFTHGNIDKLTKALKEHKDNENIINQLLSEEQQPSLISWALEAFRKEKKGTEVYKIVLEIIPIQITKGRGDTSKEKIYDEVFEDVLTKKLEPSTLMHTVIAANIIEKDNKISSNIVRDIQAHSKKIIAQAIDDPKWAKETLHTIFQIIDNDTDAIDFYIDMHIALKTEKPEDISNLLMDTDRNILEGWLLLKDIFEDTTDDVMTQILDIAKTDTERAFLFNSAVSVGIPPISLYQDENKIAEMNKNLKNSFKKALEHNRQLDFDVFKGKIDFVIANTNKEEFAKILVHTDKYASESLIEMALIKNKEKYLNVFLEKIETETEVADILYKAAQVTSISQNADILMDMSDKLISNFIEIDTKKTATIIYPDKLGNIHPTGSNKEKYVISYFSRNMHDTKFSDKDTKTYINVISERDGFIKIDNNLINPEYWDIICYCEINEEINFSKNNIGPLSFPLKAEDATKILMNISEISINKINIQNTIILDSRSFETLRYDKDIQELIINKNIVLPDVSETEFSSILKQIRKQNEDILYIEEENLVLNIKSIDGIYKSDRQTYVNEKSDNKEEWEQFIVNILINGHNICVKDLLKEKEYSIDTEIKALQKQEDILISSILEQLEKRNNFKKITEEISINTENVILVKPYEDHSVVLLTEKNKYSVEQTSKEVLEWINYTKLIKSPFIEKENGQYKFNILNEEVILDKKNINEKAVSRTHTTILDNFLCNIKDICEVSIDKDDAVITIKATNESVSIEVKDIEISRIVKKLGLENTVLGKKKTVTKKIAEKISKVKDSFNQTFNPLSPPIGKTLDFFSSSNDNSDKTSNLYKIKHYSSTVYKHRQSLKKSKGYTK